jgi:hypothetical protein
MTRETNASMHACMHAACITMTRHRSKQQSTQHTIHIYQHTVTCKYLHHAFQSFKRLAVSMKFNSRLKVLSFSFLDVNKHVLKVPANRQAKRSIASRSHRLASPRLASRPNDELRHFSVRVRSQQTRVCKQRFRPINTEEWKMSE